MASRKKKTTAKRKTVKPAKRNAAKRGTAKPTASAPETPEVPATQPATQAPKRPRAASTHQRA
jgi:hypothetical protein